MSWTEGGPGVHNHRPSANPRVDRCDCGQPVAHSYVAPAPADKAGDYEEYVPRDIALERHYTDLAARSAGFLKPNPEGWGPPVGDTLGLDEFADARAWSGGVRANIDAIREAQEELADCRHYLVWGIQQIERAYIAGDSEAGDVYARCMRALAAVVEAWHALAGSTKGSG